jgi:hypothetical protein
MPCGARYGCTPDTPRRPVRWDENESKGVAASLSEGRFRPHLMLDGASVLDVRNGNRL